MAWEDIVKQKYNVLQNEKVFDFRDEAIVMLQVEEKLKALKNVIVNQFIKEKKSPNSDLNEFLKSIIKRIESLTEDIIRNPNR
tara:strand:+ start:639 stop:887 length:249 start_codon:yes stop_codon:yes gene_type:complete